MRSTTTLLIIACCLLAGAMAETFTSEQQKCIENLPAACKSSSSSTCASDYQAFGECQLSKCGTKSTLSEYGACVTDECAGSNSDVQNYAKGVRACVYSSILSLSVALFLILALLF